MNRSAPAAYLLALIVMNGCASAPFEPVKLISVRDLDPGAVLKTFKTDLPEKFEIVESAVVTYRGRELASALGYTEVNEKEDSLALAGFTLSGMKLFEVKAAGTEVESSFSIPMLDKKVDLDTLAQAVAEDVRRIYMKRSPGPNAEIRKSKNSIIYREASGRGVLEFVFGGAGWALIEKNYREGRRKLWSVRYFDYSRKASKMYPNKVYFENHQRKYTVALRLKEILA